MAETPSYEQKKFIEYSVAKPDSFSGIKNSQSLPIDTIRRVGVMFGATDAQRALASQLTNMGLGGMTIGQFNQSLNDANFVQQYGLGKAYSYSDLAKEALSSDPNFDPNDAQTVSTLAQDIEKRGLDNTKREDIRTLATNQGIKGQIDRATNPGKYLTDAQKTANLSTANRLLKQNFGDSYNDPDLANFLSERLAEGESAFEVSQFLQTTPQYQKMQADVENKRVADESAAARQSLNTELLKGQDEAFARATPAIIASYMRAGRLDSSGLNNALAKARADLENERQGFIANAAYSDAIRGQGYRREDFVNNNANAFNQYLRQNEPYYQQKFAVQNASNFNTFQQPYNNLARQYSLNDQARQRQYDIEDYDRQQSDFNRYMADSRNQSRSAALYGLLGAGISGGLQGWAMRR